MLAVIKPTESSLALPGCCFMPMCGSATRDWYVDTGVDWDFWGRVYICSECIKHIAHIAGFLTQDQKEKYDEYLSQTDRVILELQTANRNQEQIIRGFYELLTSGLSSVPDNQLTFSDAMADEVNQGTASGMVLRETDSDESSDESGLADVPSIRSDESESESFSNIFKL